ncbi:MAG TPA: ubiquitin-conjugating enzyme E2 [Chitinivibrionales bacterium]|nr:ubiquitin-conjugating enzyme E2 [Chitinivibrionales bacterium]
MMAQGLAAGKNGVTASVNTSPPRNPKSAELRLQRLLAEHELLKKFIATHLYIHIKEEFGFPPEKYHLVFRVDGLLQAGKSIEPKSEHIVEILLPDDYPETPPVCSMLSPIFHPNISDERIDIKEEWNPETTVADLVVKIGQMIVFQRYSAKAPLNKDAAQWAVNNGRLLPLSAVDFTRTAEAAPAPPAKASAPARPQQVAVVKEQGDAETIVLEGALAPLAKDAAPREDDTAQLALEAIASTVAAEAAAGTRQVSAPKPVQAPAVSRPGVTAEKKPAAPRAAPIAQTAAPAMPVKRPQERQLFRGPVTEPERKLLVERIAAVFKIECIFCVRCGKRHDAETVFCSRCGARLYKRDPKRITKMALAVCAVVALFLAAEAGILTVLINL